MSFYHNLFAREHNAFVDEFRKQARADSGRRFRAAQSGRPGASDPLRDVTPDELFEAARLVVAAEIAKIHTIEWTTATALRRAPVFKAMNANWNGLLRRRQPGGGGGAGADRDQEFRQVGGRRRKPRHGIRCSRPGRAFSAWAARSTPTTRCSPFSSNKKDIWDIRNPDHVNGGVNHFGSPFNFPEEFVTVYRLHRWCRT